MASAVEEMFSRAMAAFQSGSLDDSKRYFDETLQLDPKHVGALNLTGILLIRLGRFSEAEPYLLAALDVNPNSDATFHNYGLLLKALNRPAEALERFRQALELNPNVADTWNNRGIVLGDLGRHHEALAAYDKALTIDPRLAAAWLSRGDACDRLARYPEALAAYDRALPFEPASAWIGCGNVRCHLKQYDEALTAYERALAIKPDLAGAWLGRGTVYYEVARYAEAHAAYDKALQIDPDFALAWLGHGNVFCMTKQFAPALAAYDRALVRGVTEAEAPRFFCKINLCDWKNYDAELSRVRSSISDGTATAPPLTLIAITSSPEQQFRCTTQFCQRNHPVNPNPIWRGERYRHERIRVGYFSADFHNHATSTLMVGMFERHDRSKFEITAFSFGPDTQDDIRLRVKAAFERFVDVQGRSAREIAALAKTHEIDIAVDLKGFTLDARTDIFAARCAPIQVNYLGFPGTMGASYIDYIIADRHLIPEPEQSSYIERVVYLPNSYQVNDDRRAIADTTVTRPEVGLSTSGFVFCCFNNNYKITPEVFDCWMRVLKRTENSVLWLLEDNDIAASNLRKEAAARGVSPARLVFAKRCSTREHLQRQGLADLFLDTLPFNAHTTASDALWAGLPVLTNAGSTFAGRVAASLLHALGLPELVTTTPRAYEELAIELATNPDALTGIRRKLAVNRLSAPLFDTALFTRHIEAAYAAMHARHQAGFAPDHIDIRP